jgi:hypothetical protein
LIFNKACSALTGYEEYLRDGHETPMSFAYNASCLLRVIRKNEANISSFTFTDALGTELSHQGHLLDLSMIKDMIEGQLEGYQKLLQRSFFFGDSIPSEFLPDFEIEKLVDNSQARVVGYTFIEDPRNGLDVYKSKYGEWFLSDKIRCSRYTYCNSTGIIWKPKEAIELVKSFQALDLELAPGLIFSAGPSTRGTEFGRHLLREMLGATRNLGIVHHSVSLNATTDKSSHQRLIDHFIPHLPTREWANILLRHLVIYWPFIEYLVEQVFKDDQAILQRYRFYLFPGISQCMTSQRLSDKMSQITRNYLGKAFGIKLWRILTTVILQYVADDDVNELNRQYYFDTANMHSTNTATFKYGGNIGNMLGADPRVVSGCVRVAMAWHKRIGIGQAQPTISTNAPPTVVSTGMVQVAQPTALAIEQIKALRDESISTIKACVTETMAQCSLIYFPRPPPPKSWLPAISDIEVHPSRLLAFRQFMRDPHAQWSCPQQAVFVENLICGRENVLGILGTGFGKTTTIMFVAKMFSAGQSTIVIMPLAALHEDFHARARAYGLTASRWSSTGKFDSTSLIITAAIEDLVLDKFIE